MIVVSIFITWGVIAWGGAGYVSGGGRRARGPSELCHPGPGLGAGIR
jgi:hypothetical protein